MSTREDSDLSAEDLDELRRRTEALVEMLREKPAHESEEARKFLGQLLETDLRFDRLLDRTSHVLDSYKQWCEIGWTRPGEIREGVLPMWFLVRFAPHPGTAKNRDVSSVWWDGQRFERGFHPDERVFPTDALPDCPEATGPGEREQRA